MKQFVISFPNEYTEKILAELTDKMGFLYDRNMFLIAWNERDIKSTNNLIRIGTRNRFICVDCNDRDWIFNMVVRCNNDEANSIKELLLEWDNKIRMEYHQKHRECGYISHIN